jgi:hypothetical protein
MRMPICSQADLALVRVTETIPAPTSPTIAWVENTGVGMTDDLMMEIAEFSALAVREPFRRTEKGQRALGARASSLTLDERALLGRFTGETLLEYLVAPGESDREMLEVARQLFRRESNK